MTEQFLKSVNSIGELRAIQEEKFLKQMALIFKAHPYYIELFNKVKLRKEDIKGLEDLHKIPLTFKKDYIMRPEDFRLKMDLIPDATLEEKTLWEIIFTAGSTAAPTPFYDTSYDHYGRISQLKTTAEILGITSDDTIINLFPLTSIPHQGYLSAFYASQAIGAKHISGFGGSYDGGFGLIRRSTEILKMIERQRVTVLWGIGFYLRRLIMQAQEIGCDFSSVRLVLPMGEGCPTGMREDIRKRLEDLGSKSVKILNGYGFTEMQGPSVECTELKGFHIPKPERYFFEILDPNTFEPLSMNEVGLVVMTHLDRRGTCLLRYVVGDLSSLNYEICNYCGRWQPRFNSIPYRTGNIVKVKGTLVNISVLYEILSKIKPIEDYEIILTKTNPSDPFSEDVLLIKIACEEDRQSEILEIVTKAVKQSQEVTPKIEFVHKNYYSEILKSYKFKRFRDLRKKIE